MPSFVVILIRAPSVQVKFDVKDPRKSAARAQTGQCEFCAFPIPTDDEAPQCAVCLDGQADPWAIIREIRGLFAAVVHAPEVNELVAPEAEPVNVFETDATIIAAVVSASWPDLASYRPVEPMKDRIELEVLLQRRCGYAARGAREMVSLLLAYHEQFHGHWHIISEAVVRRWSTLPPVEIEGLGGTVSDLAALISRHYGVSMTQARCEIMGLLADLHFGTLVALGKPVAPILRSHARRISVKREYGSEPKPELAM